MSPKKQDGTQSRRTETGGSPHPANNRPDEFYEQPSWPLGWQKSLNQVLGSLNWL